jgi:hypothetical protein
MNLSIIKQNEPRALKPPNPGAMAQLRARPHGDRTIGESLDEGKPVCVDGDWIVPELLTIDDGNSLRRAAPGELTFETSVDNTTPNPVAIIEARIGEQLVHRSCSVELRKGIVVEKQDVATVIMTKYGPMLTSDLQRRDPEPGRLEYWMRLSAEQAADGIRETLRRYNPAQLEERTTPTGVEHWELVHASAMPRGKPQ